MVCPLARTRFLYCGVGRGDLTLPGGFHAGLNCRDATCRDAGCLKPTLRPLRCFYPRPPWGGRPARLCSCALLDIFLSTPSAGRATRTESENTPATPYFYPRPPWGGRPSRSCAIAFMFLFLSTPSVGRATTTVLALPSWRTLFLSTPSVGRATVEISKVDITTNISIHVLRGEGDGSATTEKQSKVLFLATPSVGRATASRCGKKPVGKFLSTPSVGRATNTLTEPGSRTCYFYPRPPWGGRRFTTTERTQTWEFLSTPSVGRATKYAPPLTRHQEISIHALRGEGDF